MGHHPIAKARLVAREFKTGDTRGELFARTPGVMAMRTVISRAITRCEDGAKRSIMLADVKAAFLSGDARRSLYVELPSGPSNWVHRWSFRKALRIRVVRVEAKNPTSSIISWCLHAFGP